MGILKKIAKIFLIFIGFIFVLDVYLQLSSQHRIPGTKCYLEDLHGLDIARLVYKPFPLWTKSKELIEYSIDEVFWNSDSDIIALHYNHENCQVAGYYLLVATKGFSSVSPYEPYTIHYFKTKDKLEKFCQSKNIYFSWENGYRWKE